MQSIQINNFSNLPNPSSIEFGFVPFMGASTMTTQQGKTLTGVTKWKRKIIVTWTDVKDTDMQNILLAVYSSQYKSITYNDPYAGGSVTKAFVMEDEQSLPVKYWNGTKKYYTTISFIFVERECSSDINNG